jgi:hypothetical protein
VISDSRFHRRRDAQRAVELAEIVKPEVERNRRTVIFQFLAKSIR